jgi:hypothetical protein
MIQEQTLNHEGCVTSGSLMSVLIRKFDMNYRQYTEAALLSAFFLLNAKQEGPQSNTC